MSDLKNQLRFGTALLNHEALIALCEKAADEIEKLRGRLENCEEQVARLKRERMWKP